MPDEIAPALTPEEWKRVHARITSTSAVPLWEAFAEIKCTPAALMASLNAAMLDDDPRKITRQDVALLERMIRGLDADHAWLRGEDQPAGAALAAKLAALLPPNQ